MPRDGTRVVRARGDCGAAQRALRLDQGGPRGAAGRGPRLHGLRAGADGARRLAAQRVAHAGAETILWRHLFSARGPARPAGISGDHHHFAGDLAGGWKNEARQTRGRGRSACSARCAIITAGPKTEDGGQATDDSPLAVAGGAAFEKCFQYFYENFECRAHRAAFEWCTEISAGVEPEFSFFRAAAIQGRGDRKSARRRSGYAAATLRAMARGGIHDHIGGGFHRYSVDDGWFVPHFEKMLYDQAQIALNCLEAKQATGDERFAWLARDIFDYVARDLTSPAGGFFSAEDADSAEVPGGPGQITGARGGRVLCVDGGGVARGAGRGLRVFCGPLRRRGKRQCCRPPRSAGRVFGEKHSRAAAHAGGFGDAILAVAGAGE